MRQKYFYFHSTSIPGNSSTQHNYFQHNKCNTECHALALVPNAEMLKVILTSAIMLKVILLSLIMLKFILMSVAVQDAILSVVMLKFNIPSAATIDAIMLSVIML